VHEARSSFATAAFVAVAVTALADKDNGYFWYGCDFVPVSY
jgi:hypothetical protein